ncbi:MAG: DNA adenine methylase [Eubacteriaceae bacterium]|nr:DNA adenine methylase [Eubacteriaceae bacterium]
MNPIIKWPGGKSNEISKIEYIIPSYKRYIEPFFGGGALFFYLHPQKAEINDISSLLIEYYKLIKDQDKNLYDLLLCYNNSFINVLNVCNNNYDEILNVYQKFAKKQIDKNALSYELNNLITSLADKLNYGFSEKLLLDEEDFINHINKMLIDKMDRTVINNIKKPFSDEDLKNNLLTGFTSGYYMYFRKVYNDINLGKIKTPSIQYKAANFYFIREYCYGSMFRYNSKGEFNIPYGGMTYNTKNFKNKINNMFNKDVESIFKNTEIYCSDFEEFFKKCNLSDNDFMFLDPPYDTDFSDYEGKDFSKYDQERLAYALRKTLSKFILVIKNTEFISKLYKDNSNILSFDNQYTYNVRSRNERNVEHLIITNIPV